MFERFTEEARQVVVMAQEGARRLSHDAIGTEHLLLGLLGDPAWASATVLLSLGIDRAYVNDEIIRTVGRGAADARQEIPFTPQAKRALELSGQEAEGLGHNAVGTEHVLLALTREPESTATQILIASRHDGDAVRTAVTRWLESRDRPPPSGPAARARVSSSASFSVLPDPALRLTLMRAAARALEDGRESYGLADLMGVVDPDALPGPDRA